MLSMVKDLFNCNDSEFIGAFLYGSQNYGLATEESDVDIIVILKTASADRQELKTHNGRIKIYTIKHFLACLTAGDLECYEILCTKHRIVNHIYEQLFDSFIEELLSCLNYSRIKRSLCKKLDEHLAHALWILRRNDPARYNKKRLYWAIRVHNQLKRIDAGDCFKDSLVYQPYDDCDLIKIKTITNYLTQKELSQIIKDIHIYKDTVHTISCALTPEEQRCMTSFYNNITKLGVDC